MTIPVFVSLPRMVDRSQQRFVVVMRANLERLGLEPMTVSYVERGGESPLKVVLDIARTCYGGIILGLMQRMSYSGLAGNRPDSGTQGYAGITHWGATPWNQLEAGVLFALDLPLIIFRESGIVGGIFDRDSSDNPVHNIQPNGVSGETEKWLNQVLNDWHRRVRLTWSYRSSGA